MSRSFKLSATLAIFAVVTAAALGFMGHAKAFNNTYPDTVGDISSGASVYAVIGQTQFVQRTGSNLRVWFPTSAGGTITIGDGNFCSSNAYDYIQNGDYFASHGIGSGTAVTNFVVNGVTKYGYYYGSGDARCKSNITFAVSGLGGIENGYYYADITISYRDLRAGAYDGLMNYFRIGSSVATSFIGVRTPPGGTWGTGYDSTQEQVDTSPTNSTYYERFGSPCNLAANQTAQLKFFDLDNAGGSGAQLNGDVSVILYDRTGGASIPVTLSSPSGGWGAGSTPTHWVPVSVNNAAQTINFVAAPGHKYLLEILNVYYNNTIQFSLPYSQINYLSCKGATVTPGATVDKPVVGTGTTVTFVNTVTTSGAVGTGADSFDWATASSGASPLPGAPAGAVTSGANLLLTPDRLAASTSYSVAFATPGTYCRRITVSGYPAYVKTPIGTSAQACVTVLPVPTCTGVSSPSTVQPGDKTDVTVGFSGPGSASITSVTYTAAGFIPGSGSASINPPAGSGKATIFGITVPSTAGTYPISWSPVPNPTAMPPCNGTVNVVDLPIFNVYGSGVRSGGGFPANGSAGNGILASWFDNSAGHMYGSSTGLNAIAMVNIVGFASKQAVFGAGNPTGLSFANTALISGSSPSATLGGNFDTGGSYSFDDPGQPGGASDPGGSISATTLSSMNGVFNHSGDLNIAGGTIKIKHNVSIFVNGNVYIGPTGIGYDTGTVWGTSTDIPSFVVVATGNIYIDNDAAQVDGVYIAKPSGGGGGQIYTCAQGMNSFFNSGDMYNQCNNQLTIHGVFVANRVNLMRTFGTLKDATSPAPSNCTDGGIPNERKVCSAEVFDFSPELYLSKPNIKSSNTATVQYDSIVSLPPVL